MNDLTTDRSFDSQAVRGSLTCLAYFLTCYSRALADVQSTGAGIECLDCMHELMGKHEFTITCSKNKLTHSRLQISLTRVVWISSILENNLGINSALEKYLKENCLGVWDEHFSFKYFLKIALVREISLKLSSNFGCLVNIIYCCSKCPDSTMWRRVLPGHEEIQILHLMRGQPGIQYNRTPVCHPVFLAWMLG